MKVWVVMSNDFPAAVFDEEDTAEKYCNMKMKEQREAKFRYTPLIYYRKYVFEVNSKKDKIKC